MQCRDKAFLSASLSCLLFSLSSRCYNAHTEISLQPPLHSSSYSLLDIFSSCTVPYSLIPSLVLALFPHLLHSLLLSLTAYSIQKNLLQKSSSEASLVILLFTYLQAVSLLRSTPCALSHLPLSSLVLSSPLLSSLLSSHRCRASCMSSCRSSTTAARTWSARCCPWRRGWSSSPPASTPCLPTSRPPSAPSTPPWSTCSERGTQGMVEEVVVEEEALWSHCPQPPL